MRISLKSDDILRRYQAGESVNQLAKVFGVDRSVIAKLLDQFGIKRRGLGEAQRAAWQVAHPVEITRTCSACGEVKPIDQFHLHDGHRRHSCKMCFNQRAQEWRAANPHKIHGYNSDWYSRNRDVAIANTRKRRTGANEAAFKAARRAHYVAHKEEIISSRAYRRGALGKFTKADIAKIRKLQRNCCAICGKRLSREHIDHITPLSKGGTNWPRNIQLLCGPCNLRKQARDPIDHMRSLGRLL